MLTSIPKISDLTKNNFVKLNLAQNDEKVRSKYFSASFRSFGVKLTCSLPKGFQKEALPFIKLSIYFGFNNFRNASPMRPYFFFRNWKFHVETKIAKEIQGKFYGFLDNLI